MADTEVPYDHLKRNRGAETRTQRSLERKWKKTGSFMLLRSMGLCTPRVLVTSLSPELQ